MYYLKSEKKNAHVRGATAPPMQLRQISRRATPFRSQTRPQQLHTRCRRRMLPPPYATVAVRYCRRTLPPPHALSTAAARTVSRRRRARSTRPIPPSFRFRVVVAAVIVVVHRFRPQGQLYTAVRRLRLLPAAADDGEIAAATKRAVIIVAQHAGCRRARDRLAHPAAASGSGYWTRARLTALQLSCDRSCARPARSVRRRYPGFRLPDLLGRLMSTSLFSCSSASPLATARVMKIVPALMMPHVASAKLATEAAARGDICGRLRGDGSTARHAPGAREIRNNPATDWDSYRADRSGREFCSWLSRRAAAQARGCELPTSHSKGT